MVFCAESPLEAVGTISKEPLENFYLPWIELSVEPVEQLTLGNQEFNFPEAGLLRPEHRIREVGEPEINIQPSVGGLQGFVRSRP